MALRRGSIFLTKDTTLGGALPKPHFLFPSSRALRNHFASHLSGGVGGGYDSHLWVWGPLLEIPSPAGLRPQGGGAAATPTWPRRLGTGGGASARPGRQLRGSSGKGASARRRRPAPGDASVPARGGRGGARPGLDERWIPPRGHRHRGAQPQPPSPRADPTSPSPRGFGARREAGLC